MLLESECDREQPPHRGVDGVVSRATPPRSTATHRSRIAERVGGGISAFEPDLMRPLALERDEEVRVNRDPAVRVDVDLRDPSADSLGVELRVDGRIEGIGYVNAPAVAAHFEHLRTAV